MSVPLSVMIKLITCNHLIASTLQFRPESTYPGRMTVCLDLDDTLTLMKYDSDLVSSLSD